MVKNWRWKNFCAARFWTNRWAIIAVSSLTGAGIEPLNSDSLPRPTRLQSRDAAASRGCRSTRIHDEGVRDRGHGNTHLGELPPEDELEVCSNEKARAGAWGAGSWRFPRIETSREAANSLNLELERHADLLTGNDVTTPCHVRKHAAVDVMPRAYCLLPACVRNRARVSLSFVHHETVAEIVLHESRTSDASVV